MEKYLHKCLCSLIIEDKSLFETLDVLVVNDGSKDSSSQIGHEYEKIYPGVFRVIDKENGNYGSCVNRGVKEAKGKYIKILDADDYFDSDGLSNYLKELSSIEADIIFSDFVKVDNKGNKRMYYSYSNFPNNTVFPSSIIPFNINIWMHAVAYRTQLLHDIHYHQTEGISYTDQEWIFLPFNACKNASYINVCLYHYQVGRNGQTMDPKVFAKNIGQEVQGTLNMINSWKGLRMEERNAQEYLKYRIMTRCREIYKSAFIYGGYKHFNLIQFENKLKCESVEIYEECKDFVICANRFAPKMQLVRTWRETGDMRRIQRSFQMILTKAVLFAKKLLHSNIFQSRKMLHQEAVSTIIER